jgi:GNAT superfamily N-acetyltransferase
VADPSVVGRSRAAVTFRAATSGDAAALADLEETANLRALGHVFPPARFPFPREGVLDRWRAVLSDPEVVVEVVDGEAGLVCFLAYDARTLRHLAVHPDHWGTGLARRAVERAVTSIVARGNRPRLWCLADNHRALGCYRHLGWTPSGPERRAEWPPYPIERELVLAGSDS